MVVDPNNMKIKKDSAAERPAKPRLTLHLRVLHGEVTAIGPGKVELLGHIAETGSIAEAARRMGMSYNRAWLHVKIMNESFKEPLVLSSRGGQARGGASLSPMGEKVKELYDAMRQEAFAAVVKSEKLLMKLLVPMN